MRDEAPRHQKKAVKGRFGIKLSEAYTRWYATEKARDKAFRSLVTKNTLLKLLGYTRQHEKVER